MGDSVEDLIESIAQCAMKLEDDLESYKNFRDGYRGPTYDWQNVRQTFESLEDAFQKLQAHIVPAPMGLPLRPRYRPVVRERRAGRGQK